jgi:hypothetical protein
MIQKSSNIGYGMRVRRWLDQQFPGYGIGRRVPVERPPRYPNLTPLDFLFVKAFEGHDVTDKNTKRGTPK